MTQAVALDAVTKSFGAAEVLVGIDLQIQAGEVMALLGPSGCGKSTLLRLIAGLEQLDSGTVSLAGQVVSGTGTHVAPEKRHVGMIFQNGALFPHLDVTRNVGYGLERNQRRGGPRVDEMLDLVGLSGFGDRMPDALSGGEQQRVALARALAPSPSVVLMDEPFSNLDALLRHRLRREVGDVVRAAGVTTLFVTHDRDEAFAIADRVAVMRGGRICQVATPRELYRCPADPWLAAFVGDANWWPGDELVRPEDLEFVDAGATGALDGTVVNEEYLGSSVVTEVRLDDDRVVLVRSLPDAAARTSGSRVHIRVRGPEVGRRGQ